MRQEKGLAGALLRPSSSEVVECVQTLVLNPASALSAAIAIALVRRSEASLSDVVNPWGLSPLWWCVGYAVVRAALLGFVDALVFVVGPHLPALPSRTGPKPTFQHSISFLDVAYLVINSMIEYVFALQIGHLLWNAPFIARAPGSISLRNFPLAFWLLLVVDDMLYAPLHRLMHHPAVYRWVHKHHHRNTFPARGYIDAANEHPVEQLAALTLHWIAAHIVAFTSGLHVAAVGAHFGIKALGACFNHTGYDLQISFLGIDYSVRAHETHHRKPQTNFAQYVMFWDRLMGTYRAYESGQPKLAKGEAQAGSPPLKRAEPDRLPAWADPAVEARSGHVSER